jgi:uncharacterized protein (TIGR02757 family)
MIGKDKKVMRQIEKLRSFLDEKVLQYNCPDFIGTDPISIPHRFKKIQDIEIAALFAATLAWGQRKTIINKCSELMERMDNDPHQFILFHQEQDLKPLASFVHRTFNGMDSLYFIDFLHRYYQDHDSLQDAFTAGFKFGGARSALIDFRENFFSVDYAPARTRKHLSTPKNKSACKRLNMFLRWMVRKDQAGVDFGIWQNIDPAALICPLDLHVERIARKLGLITRKQVDWETAEELTANLRQLDSADPVKYDFALFGLGAFEGA